MDDAQSSNNYLFRISKIIPETPDTKSFVLEDVNGREVSYTAGQFLTFLFEKKNGEEERRNYSVSSIPSSDDPLTITVKRIPNGEYSRRLIDTIQVGDSLLSIGASGFFTLPDDMHAHDQFIFFAAGSGITPVYSLIRTLLQYHPSKSILLVYSNRSVEYTIFYAQLIELQKQYPDRFHIEFLFSNVNNTTHRRLGIHVMEKLLKHYIGKISGKQLFYLCGPFEYMRMITIVLRNHGVSVANIRKEVFNIIKPERKEEPADKEHHAITAIFQGKEYEFTAQYPQTILQSAKALQIPLPYSCEAGQCGTCAATCVSGKVWMWRNDVLLDEEIAKGRVLTCTGYAVGGDVILAY
jgi:ferredoxin-NADP reductase